MARGCRRVLLLSGLVLLTAAVAGEEKKTSLGIPALEPIAVGSPARISLYPTELRLAGTRQRGRLVITGHYEDGAEQDLTRVTQLSLADTRVARIEDGVLLPTGDGRTEVIASVGGREVSAAVIVSKQRATEPVSFLYGTLAALTKQGCNSGGCHGSPSGKGGFRLSLRGYDPVLDSVTLEREHLNRRTNRFAPLESLLLLKPMARVPHGGGVRLKESDAAYPLLSDWIAEGGRVAGDDNLRCVSIEVFPRERVLHFPAHSQQLVVQAHFSDGNVRDITDLAVYSSSEDAIAKVDDRGLVVAGDAGEVAVLVQFLEYAETARLTFLRDVPGFAWNDPPTNNFVDRHVFAKLRKMKILPSELASDAEFVRRIYLDLVGVLPTAVETEKFLASEDPAKRSRLVDELLEHPGFAEFWATKWGDLLRINNKTMSGPGVHKFHRWLVKSVRENMPYDEFVRSLVTSQGSTFSTPPANYYRAASNTDDCTETTAQLFVGVRIQCAKCHNHPFERWTQDNYYGLSAFFGRVQRKKVSATGEVLIWVSREGEVTQPRTGQTMKPWLPFVGELDLPEGVDRREVFAQWLTSTENPLLAKVEANRVWAHLMGRGIVEPVDDFRDSNPPANAELLEALAEDFKRSGFDRKHLIRTIASSRTYQLASRGNELNRHDFKYASHARTRMLTAEQLLNAICQLTGVDESFEGLPEGTLATALPSPDYGKDFLKIFGKPLRDTACECERGSTSDLARVMELINGPLVHDKVKSSNNRLRLMVKEGASNSDILRVLYLLAYSRPPNAQEFKTALDYLSVATDRLEGLEDLVWTIINSKEFLFQH